MVSSLSPRIYLMQHNFQEKKHIHIQKNKDSPQNSNDLD